MDPQIVSLSELRRFALGDGIAARALFGKDAMINLVELAPDAAIPRHSHPHEQLGVVLEGEFHVVLGGTERKLTAMDACAVPGGAEHLGHAGPEGAVVLDVFHPVREDYRSAAGAE